MTEIEVLETALASEQDAVDKYQKLIIEHPSLKDLLSFLLTEEQKHMVMIKKRITELYK